MLALKLWLQGLSNSININILDKRKLLFTYIVDYERVQIVRNTDKNIIRRKLEIVHRK